MNLVRQLAISRVRWSIMLTVIISVLVLTTGTVETFGIILTHASQWVVETVARWSHASSLPTGRSSSGQPLLEQGHYVHDGNLLLVNISAAATKLFGHSKDCVLSSTTPTFFICLHTTQEDRPISQVIRKEGMYEQRLHDRIKDQLNRCPDCLFLDVGANIGVHALYASAAGHEVIAVEPTSFHLDLLIQSVYLNRVAGKAGGDFAIIANVLSDSRGTALMSMPEVGNPGHAKAFDQPSQPLNSAKGKSEGVGTSKDNQVTGASKDKKVTSASKDKAVAATAQGKGNLAPTALLDDLIPLVAKNRPIVLKIDAEEYECRIARGGRKFLVEHIKLKAAVLEMRFAARVDKNCVDDLMRIMKSANMTAFNAEGAGTPVPLPNPVIKWPNNVMFLAN